MKDPLRPREIIYPECTFIIRIVIVHEVPFAHNKLRIDQAEGGLQESRTPLLTAGFCYEKTLSKLPPVSKIESVSNCFVYREDQEMK